MRAKSTHEAPRRGLFRPLARAFHRDEKGTSAVEFALLAAPFFAFLLLLIEVALVFLLGQALENATQGSARMIRTGQAQDSSLQSFKQSICDRIPVLTNCLDRLKVDVKVLPDFKSAAGLPTPTEEGEGDDGFGFDAGGGNDIVLVRAYYDWSGSPVLPGLIKFVLARGNNAPVPANVYTLNAAAIFRNEPFS